MKKIASNIKNNEETTSSDAIKYFLYHSTNESGKTLNRNEVMVDTLKDFGETLLHQIVPGEEQYKIATNKCLDTIDIYGVGIGLLYVLKSVHSMMDAQLVEGLEHLFLDMVKANLMDRIDIHTALNRYEDILEKCKILEKYNKHFENHVLKEGPLIPLVLEEKIESISAKSLSISPKEMGQILEEDPEALEPETSVKGTGKGTGRKTLGKRVRMESSRKLSSIREPSLVDQQSRKKTRKLVIRTIECPEGKEVNPITRRCVNKCKPGEIRNERFECRRTQRKWKRIKDPTN